MQKRNKLYFNRPPTMTLFGQMDKLLELKKKLELEQLMVLAEEEKARWQAELEKEWREMMRQKKILAGINYQLPELIDEKCKGRLIVFSKYD